MFLSWTYQKTACDEGFSHRVSNLLGLRSSLDRWSGRAKNSRKLEARKNLSTAEVYRSRISKAEGFGEVWEIVKDTVRDSLGEYRVGMMLFLDDLPLYLGAYHPLGTNNIVLNRALVQIVEVATKSKRLVNGFVYSLLLHEYLHALGHVPETEVRSLVYRISSECFGEDHIVTSLAEKSPWVLLRDIPLRGIEASRRAMEIVKDFEKPNQGYIV